MPAFTGMDGHNADSSAESKHVGVLLSHASVWQYLVQEPSPTRADSADSEHVMDGQEAEDTEQHTVIEGLDVEK